MALRSVQVKLFAHDFRVAFVAVASRQLQRYIDDPQSVSAQHRTDFATALTPCIMHVRACLQGDGVYQVRLEEEDSKLHMRVAMVSKLFNESDRRMVAMALDQTALSLTKLHK